jgi:hypothetical protein
MRKSQGAEVFSKAWEREDFWKSAKISSKTWHFLEKPNLQYMFINILIRNLYSSKFVTGFNRMNQPYEPVLYVPDSSSWGLCLTFLSLFKMIE